MSPVLLYGIFTGEQRKAIVAIQKGRCAICGCGLEALQRRYCVIDHDAATGLVRGALCQSCNVRLGQAEHGKRPLSPEQRSYLERAPLNDASLETTKWPRIALTMSEVITLREIGSGSVTAGVRLLLAEHQGRAHKLGIDAITF